MPRRPISLRRLCSPATWLPGSSTRRRRRARRSRSSGPAFSMLSRFGCSDEGHVEVALPWLSIDRLLPVSLDRIAILAQPALKALAERRPIAPHLPEALLEAHRVDARYTA